MHKGTNTGTVKCLVSPWLDDGSPGSAGVGRTADKHNSVCHSRQGQGLWKGRTLGKDLWRDEMSADSASGDTLHSGRFFSAKAQHPNWKLVAAGGVEEVVSLECYWCILVLGAAAAVPFYHGVFPCSCTLD